MHRLVSKFGRDVDKLEAAILPLLDGWADAHFGADDCAGVDTAVSLRAMYWRVVLVLVLGDASDASTATYEHAWTTCLERLDSPTAFLFWFARFLPTPLNLRYQRQSDALRAVVRRAVDKAWDADIPAQGPAEHGAKEAGAATFSFLHLLRDEPPARRLSREDAVEVLLELLFTGASSVTTTIVWMLWLLAAHPTVQQKVHAELVAMTPPASGTPTLAHTPRLEYLDAVMRETLRLYSPIHVGRLCQKDDAFLGFNIPKGTDIAANFWFIHRNPENWPEPDAFKPERFLGKPFNVPHFHPFSMGVRGCPGRQVAFALCKLVVGRVAARFELAPAPSAAPPRFSSSVVLSNTPAGVYITARRR